ncbi:unnamed protein product [Nippostrongylus brasiliensis]|uniref:Uncharacterized protein n=1 Tax=Nippostrongylus brasiliensis TaxID=27835 RepID=A0A0N4YSY7_NIPBR|nr:unnamed protein product [Nippostrongylus brasiliensis]
MVEAEHSSSDEEMDTGVSALEAAALARKKRLLEMKSRLHGIEMKSYKPLSEAVGKIADATPKLDVVEEVIASHLEKLDRRTQKCIAEMIRQRLSEGKGDLASAVNADLLVIFHGMVYFPYSSLECADLERVLGERFRPVVEETTGLAAAIRCPSCSSRCPLRH